MLSTNLALCYYQESENSFPKTYLPSTICGITPLPGYNQTTHSPNKHQSNLRCARIRRYADYAWFIKSQIVVKLANLFGVTLDHLVHDSADLLLAPHRMRLIIHLPLRFSLPASLNAISANLRRSIAALKLMFSLSLMMRHKPVQRIILFLVLGSWFFVLRSLVLRSQFLGSRFLPPIAAQSGPSPSAVASTPAAPGRAARPRTAAASVARPRH